MRTLQRNKRSLKYSLLESKDAMSITDSEGNILETGESGDFYSFPVDFKANIVMRGNGYAEMVEFGLNPSEYNAVIVVAKNSLPLVEGSLIWDNSEPKKDRQGYIVKSSADYEVVKVAKTPNVDKFILKRLVNS